MQSFKRLKIQTHFELLRNVPSKLPTNYQMKKLSRGLLKKKNSHVTTKYEHKINFGFFITQPTKPKKCPKYPQNLKITKIPPKRKK